MEGNPLGYFLDITVTGSDTTVSFNASGDGNPSNYVDITTLTGITTSTINVVIDIVGTVEAVVV